MRARNGFPRWQTGAALALALWCVSGSGGAMPFGATAEAYVIGGSAWPGGHITYAVTSPALRAPAREAARAWNRSGARVHFVEVPRRRARVLVRFGDRPTGFGFASLGRQASNSVTVGPGSSDPGLFAHEFGHILGLNHETRGCVLMSPFYLAGCARPRHDWQKRCSSVQRDDALGAVRIYGGRVRRIKAFCDIAPPPKPPVGIDVQPGRTGARAYRPIVRFRAPAGAYAALVEVTRFTGACPRSSAAARGRDDAITFRRDLGTEANNSRGYRRTSRGGQLLTLREPADRPFPRAADTYCYRLVTGDRFGRESRATTLVYFHRPVLPPIPPVVSVTLNPPSGTLMYGDGIELTVAATDDGSVRQISVDCSDGQPAVTRERPRDEELFGCGFALTGRYEPGAHVVRITATDDEGATTTVTRSATVLPVPVEPVPIDPLVDPLVDPPVDPPPA